MCVLYVCVHVDVCRCPHTCGGQESSSTALYLVFWNRGTHWTWSSLIWQGSLANKRLELPCFTPSVSTIRVIDTCHTPSFYMSAGDLNSGPHASVAVFFWLSHLLSPWLFHFKRKFLQWKVRDQGIYANERQLKPGSNWQVLLKLWMFELQ